MHCSLGFIHTLRRLKVGGRGIQKYYLERKPHGPHNKIDDKGREGGKNQLILWWRRVWTASCCPKNNPAIQKSSLSSIFNKAEKFPIKPTTQDPLFGPVWKETHSRKDFLHQMCNVVGALMSNNYFLIHC